MALSALDKLRLFLRPPGRGIYTHSTGGGFAARLQKRLYGTDDATAVQTQWEDDLQKVRRARAFVIGVPSDTGAGIMRGANFGPIGVREAYLLAKRSYPRDVLDLGDIICVPQLLHDEMLSDGQLDATRKALYPGVAESLPVSPLSIAEKTLETLRELNPSASLILIGGDHSVSWPASVWAQAVHGKNLGLLHFDAHTDLMESRLGVKYCFGTWAYHAQKLLDPAHLVQVGLRTSSKPKEFWMQKYPVEQVWASEIRGKETAAIERVVAHFHKLGVAKVYISNDIDGTDAAMAPATGTPEGGGLTPAFVSALITAVGQAFRVVGGDVVEVAPPLSGRREFGDEPTCQLAAHYMDLQLTAALRD